MAAKWRKILNKIHKENAIRCQIKTFPSGSVYMYVFHCEICSKEIQMREQHIPYSTGRCKKHAQLHLPYEAVYGAILRSGKVREIPVSITYTEYLTFVNTPCYYCNGDIPWEPYNEHGKNNPGYYLDRKNPKEGYTVENCVACCTKCNMMKRGMLEDDFVGHAMKITKWKGGSCGS